MNHCHLLIAMLVPFILGGCSLFSSSDSGCMKTAFVSSLSKMPLSRVAKGDHRTLAISHFQGGCGGSGPHLPGTADDIGISVTFTTPPAKHYTGKSHEIKVPLFLALLDKEDNVLDRQDEMVTLTLTDEALEHRHAIIYHPPEGIEVDSQDHRLLVGFNAEAKSCPKAACAPIAKKPVLKKETKRKLKVKTKPKLKLKRKSIKKKRIR